MADDVFYYIRKLPHGVKEMVTPCADGYTVYISSALDDEHILKAYEHALEHIRSGHFDIENVSSSVQKIEADTHGSKADAPPDAPPVPGDDRKDMMLERLRVQRRKLTKLMQENEKKIRFLQENGHDFFAAAEEQYLKE